MFDAVTAKFKKGFSHIIKKSSDDNPPTDKQPKPQTIKISKKAIVLAVVVILILVFGAYALTFLLPRGEYQRSAEGSIIQGTYRENPELDGIAWWEFLLSPVMILLPSSEGSTIVYAIIILLFVIGAIFTALDESGILVYMIYVIRQKFESNKYKIIFITSFAFMFLGSAVGMFEELIPLVPIVVLLAYAMGWDALLGLGMSILACCFGFAAGVVNPFTVGISQTLGGIVMFSGIGLRLLTFVIAYIMLTGFLYWYAKHIDKNPKKSLVYKEDLIRKLDFKFDNDIFYDEKKSKALKWFACWICLVLFFSLLAIFWHELANYIMYITLVVYVIAGIGACFICGMKGSNIFKLLGKGSLSLLPAVVMILVAGGVRYIIEEGDIMDTILYNAVNVIEGQKPLSAVLMIYGVIFIFEMFIPSGSAKAFLLMPIIFDICSIVNVNGQVAVLCLAFADGFSNMLLPTNGGLLLILGMTTVDIKKWFLWSLPIQLSLLAVTVGILALALVVY